MQDEPDTAIVTPRRVPWTGTEIVVGMFLAAFFWPALAQVTLQSSGFFTWFYGPQMVAAAKSKDADPSEKKAALSRMTLWSTALASPFQILTFPLLFASLSGTRLNQLGLTRRRFGRNVLAGLVGMLVLTPAVFGTYWLIQQFYARMGERVERHALELIARQDLFPSEWVLLVFTAMVAAPVLEELAFRGALQPWLATRTWGGPAAMFGSLVLAVLARRDAMLDARTLGIGARASAAAPLLFVLALVPIYLLVWWRSRSPLGPAIFGTALLFAYVHVSVWPTPIPLFVLALGLGMLAYRTQSLVGPIVLHSLFNGISCLQLLIGAKWGG